MRTTVTLDPDVANQIKVRLAGSHFTFKEIVNQTLRLGFSAPPEPPVAPFRVIPSDLGLRPGIDPDRINQYLDDLEIDDYLARVARDEA